MATITSAQIDTVVIEHRVGHRTEYFSNDGILWIRDTLDGRVLEISVEEFLADADCGLHPAHGGRSISNSRAGEDKGFGSRFSMSPVAIRRGWARLWKGVVLITLFLHLMNLQPSPARADGAAPRMPYTTALTSSRLWCSETGQSRPLRR